jgi:cell filamentation protein
MASKYHLENSLLYIDETDIPRNLLGITDSGQIHELEKELLGEAYHVFYDELSDETVFDESYFVDLHRRTFEALYDWAGKYRDFNMAKGESRFCQGAFVASSSKKIFDELKQDGYLKNSENIQKEDFAEKLAYYKCEIIAFHPFYELNGRITRLFFDLISVFNGYDYIDYSTVSPQEYIEASIDCVQLADCTKMRKIILAGLRRNS